MKTTIEISDPLLQEARALAARDGIPLRELVERGLRQVLSQRKKGKRSFKLRQASFKGRGLVPELADANWDTIRDLIYEGRGG